MKKKHIKTKLFILVLALGGLMVSWVYLNKKPEPQILLTKAKEPSTKYFSQLSLSNSFYKWKDWYPVDFGQPEGYRVINRWDQTTDANPNIHGISSLNVPNNVSTLPTTYNGNNIDYFYLWQCRPLNDSRDPQCYNQQFYREIISQGSAIDNGGKTTLEHWARGGAYSSGKASDVKWEVYYDPKVIGYDNCNGKSIAKKSNKLLRSPKSKKPLVMKLPDKVDEYYQSSPICALVFKGYYQDINKVIDSRYNSLGYNPDSLSFETGNWITITITHEIFVDSEGHKIVRAENIYLTDNTKASDRFYKNYCTNRTDKLRCGLARNVDGRMYKIFAFEEYWMRKTKISGRYPGVIDKYGFGSYKWFSQTNNGWDKIKNNGSTNNIYGAENQTYDLQKCTLNKFYEIRNCK